MLQGEWNALRRPNKRQLSLLAVRPRFAQRKTEEQLEQRLAQLSRREATVKTLSDDIVKGNEIIKRLQGELRTYHSKLRLRSEVITKQEDVLTDKEQQIQTLMRKLDDLELRQKNREAEVSCTFSTVVNLRDPSALYSEGMWRDFCRGLS